MGILDFLDQEEYDAWQRAKKRDRQQQQQLAAQRYAQQPTPWQQAFQPVQEEPMSPPAPGPGYYAAPELPATIPPLSRPQPMQLTALRPPQGPVAPSAGMAVSHEPQQQTPGDALGQLGQGALQKMDEFQEFIDRPWLRGLLTAGDVVNPLAQRGQLARSTYLMDRDAQRQYDIAREQAMEGGFQGLLPEGPVRGAAGLAGDVLHNAVFKDEPVYAPSPHPVAVPAHRPVGETFAEAWQRWSHEKENPVVEMAGSLSNPLGWPGPVEALQAGRIAVQGAKALAPSLKAIPKLAREVGPAAKGVAKGIGEGLTPVVRDMRLRPEAGAIGDLEETSPIFQRANAIAERLSPDPDEPASIYKRISELEQELGGLGESTGIVKPTSGPMRMWADDKLEAFATRTERNPYQADWWDKVDTKDIREFNESWVPSGGRTARAQRLQQELTTLRREEKALKAEYKTLSEAIMGERPAAEVLREKGLPVPGEEAVVAGLEAVAPAKQAGMFQPGEARPQMKGAIAGETIKPEDLLGGPQFEDEAARVKWEREQQVARGQTEMFGEGAAGEGILAPIAAPKQTPSVDLISIKLDDIPYQRVVQAYDGVSWTPEVRAKRVRADYVTHMQELQQKLLPLASTPEKLEVLRQGLERYKEGYLKRLNGYLAAKSRVVSSAIVGPARFPVRQMEKRVDYEHKRLTEFLEWSEKAQKALRKEIAPETSRVISSDNPEALTLLEKKIASANDMQQRMVEGNKIVRRKDLSDEQKVEQLLGLGMEEDTARKALRPDFAGRIGFPDYALKNNSAEIRRLQGRVAELTRNQATPGGEMTFDGGRIVDNPGENRIQIYFDAKPDEAMRESLKRNGFKWAPSQGTWQRQRTDNARVTVERLFPDARKAEMAQGEEEFIKPQLLDEGESAVAPQPAEIAKQPWEMTFGDIDARYPQVKDTVDGRQVGQAVPNMTSIDSSLDNPTTLEGVRDVPISIFEDSGPPKFQSATEKARTERLAEQIRQSGRVDPLIVVDDAQSSPYILEGAHRFDALKLLGAKSFPAKVVIDEDAYYNAVKQALSEGKPVPHEVISDYPDLATQYKGAGETAITEPTSLPPAEAALAATGQGAVPIETPLATAPKTPALAEIAPTPKPAVDPLQAEYAKALGANPRIGQYMRYLNQAYVKTNSPLKGFATYLDDAGNVFVARNSKEGKLNYYRVDKTGKAVPVSKASADWREVGRSGVMPAAIRPEVAPEKSLGEAAANGQVTPEGYPANTTAKQLAYIENMQESFDVKKIAGVRVYMDSRGHLFVERISNGGKSYVQQLKLDGTARDVRKGTNWTLLDENIREVKAPVTQTQAPKPPRTDEEIEAAIRARQATARQPLWAQDEMQAKALETEMPPASTGGQGPPKPPAPPLETGPAPELPSGRKPGGIEKMTPAPEADPYQRLQDALTPDRPGVRDRLRDATNRFMRETYDRNYDLGALEQLTGVPVHKLAQVVSGAVAAGEDRIRRFVLPVLQTVGDDVKHLEEYMVLMRNQDVMARNPSARLPGDIAGWAGTLEAEKRLAAQIGQERFAKVKAAAKDLWRINDEQILRPLLDEGMLDQEAYRAMRAAHPHYIDFHRADFSLVDGVERVMTRPEASVSSLNIKHMEATGSTRKLDDPLARTAAQVIRTKVLISRNRAAKAIVTALLEREAQMVAEFGVKELPEGQRLVTFLKATEAAEHSNLTDTISYFNKGEKVTVQVPPVYATIAKGLEGETAHAWERLVTGLGAPLRYGAVRYNPLFVVVNPIRDAISAFYREGLVPMSSEYIRGWVAAIHKNADFTEAAEAGVLMSGIVDNMRSTEALARARRMGVVSVHNWRDALLVLPRLIERANLTAEQATRIATYHKLKGQSLSELEAAVRARDVTVDFAKAGNTMKVINQMLPFSNAGLQGAANTVRLIKDNPRQALIASSVLAMPTIAAYLNNQRFETSKMIPDYEYVNSWVFQIGEGERKADPRYPDAVPEKFPLYVKIPKGPLGAFVTAPVELALRLAFAKDDRSVAEHFLEGAKTMVTAISPLEPNVSAILPPLGGTAVGIATGLDLYRDAPIVPQREKNRPAELQYGPETSSLAVALGERFKVNPRMVEFAIKDYTAGVGSQALWLSDLALGALGYNPQAPGEAKQRPLSEMEQLAKNPLVGRFLGTRNTQQERLGYEQLDRTVEQGRRDYMAIPEVRRLGMSLSPVSEAIEVGGRDVEMNPGQRAEFQREYNETRITGVQAMIDSSLYQKAPSDKFKQALLERMNRKTGELARDNAKLVAQGQAPKLAPVQLQTEIREYVQALHENAQLLAIPKYRSVPPEKEKVVTSIESRVSAIRAAEPRYSPAGAENQARKEGRFSDEDWQWYMRAKGNLNPERTKFVREHPIYRKWFRGAAEEYLQLRPAS